MAGFKIDDFPGVFTPNDLEPGVWDTEGTETVPAGSLLLSKFNWKKESKRYEHDKKKTKDCQIQTFRIKQLPYLCCCSAGMNSL